MLLKSIFYFSSTTLFGIAINYVQNGKFLIRVVTHVSSSTKFISIHIDISLVHQFFTKVGIVDFRVFVSKTNLSHCNKILDLKYLPTIGLLSPAKEAILTTLLALFSALWDIRTTPILESKSSKWLNEEFISSPLYIENRAIFLSET